MSVVVRYFSEDNKYAVELDDDLVQEMISYIRSAGRKETGGIFIGQYSKSRDRAIVKIVTGPPKDSKSGYTWFERGLIGLQELINQVWNERQYYLGEWHFHPYASPSPSGRDIDQMAKIAASGRYNCPEPILLIIGGSPEEFEIRVFVVMSKSKIVEIKERVNELYY
jgi:integrative and conjugative element protein (TIGR02256 family)